MLYPLVCLLPLPFFNIQKFKLFISNLIIDLFLISWIAPKLRKVSCLQSFDEHIIPSLSSVSLSSPCLIFKDLFLYSGITFAIR